MVGKPDIGELPTSELGNSEVETPAGVKFSTYGLLVTRRESKLGRRHTTFFGDTCFFAVSILSRFLSRFLRHVDKAGQPAFCSKARSLPEISPSIMRPGVHRFVPGPAVHASLPSQPSPSALSFTFSS